MCQIIVTRLPFRCVRGIQNVRRGTCNVRFILTRLTFLQTGTAETATRRIVAGHDMKSNLLADCVMICLYCKAYHYDHPATTI